VARFLCAERVTGTDCISLLSSTPNLKRRVVSVLQQKERHQDEIRIRTPTSPRLTTRINRPIRTIVDPDDLIPYVTVRIRNTLLVLDSSFYSATRTTQQKVSDFSHSCVFFCYFLAFHSSVPPSFFNKTTKPSSALSTSTSSHKHSTTCLPRIQ
jgi:hypothetical protein